MVTKAQVMALAHGAELHYTGRHDCTRHVGPRGGITEHVTRVRVSGRCQTWARRPNAFRLPVKYGLYESSAITEWNAGEWHVPADCPIRPTDPDPRPDPDPRDEPSAHALGGPA